MKVIITKVVNPSHDESELKGTVHLRGAVDTLACGIANEDFDSKPTTKPIDCEICKTYLAWAKSVSKLN